MSTPVDINGTSYEVPAAGETGYADTLSTVLQALCAATGGILTFGASAGTGGATKYARPGNGAADSTEVKMRMPVAGTLFRLRLKCTSAPTTNSLVSTVRLNGADTAITATLTTSDTSASDDSNWVAVKAGDDVSIKMTQTAGAGGTNLVFTLGFVPSYGV